MITAYPIQRAVLGAASGIQVALLSSFNPLDLNPPFWLSTTGSDPETWPDITGNGADATQATALLQPSIVAAAINGHQVRRFNGAQYMTGLTAIVGGELSVFAVVSMNNTTSAFGRAVSLGLTGDDDFDDSSFCATILRSNSAQAIASFRNSGELSVRSITYATPCITLIRYDGANETTYVNGVPGTPAASSGAFNISNLRVGAELAGGAPVGFWNGDIAEALALVSPTTQDLNNVGQFFASKFGLTWTPVA